MLYKSLPYSPAPPAFVRRLFNERCCFLLVLEGMPPAPAEPLPRLPSHRPLSTPTAAARLSMHLRLIPRP